jgi:hypothetical protein
MDIVKMGTLANLLFDLACVYGILLFETVVCGSELALTNTKRNSLSDPGFPLI